MNKDDYDGILNMLCDSIETKITIVKNIGTQNVEIEGGTGIVIFDMFLIEKALEAVAVKILPEMTSAEDLKQVLKQSIDLFDFGGGGEQ